MPFVSVLPEFSRSFSVDKPEKEVVRVSIVGEGGADEEVGEEDEEEESESSYFFSGFSFFFISS